MQEPIDGSKTDGYPQDMNISLHEENNDLRSQKSKFRRHIGTSGKGRSPRDAIKDRRCAKPLIPFGFYASLSPSIDAALCPIRMLDKIGGNSRPLFSASKRLCQGL